MTGRKKGKGFLCNIETLKLENVKKSTSIQRKGSGFILAPNRALVPLNGSYHQLITNEFRTLWPYGKGIPSPLQLKNIMKQVYTKYPLPMGY